MADDINGQVLGGAGQAGGKMVGSYAYEDVYWSGFFFFVKQKTAYEISECVWSSDVCSSDLLAARSHHPTVHWHSGVHHHAGGHGARRSEERRVGKDVKISVDLGGRRIIKKKITKRMAFNMIVFENNFPSTQKLMRSLVFLYGCVFFFFKQKTAYEISECDWSSDVCSSDLMIRHTRFLNVTGVQTCALPIDRKSTRLNSSHIQKSRMPSSA